MTFQHMHLRLFQPQNTIFTLENAFFPGFSGFLLFQQPRVHTVGKIRAKLWLLPQSRNGLGAKHRWVSFLITIQESFPKTIPLWSPKMMFHVMKSAERLFAIRD